MHRRRLIGRAWNFPVYVIIFRRGREAQNDDGGREANRYRRDLTSYDSELNSPRESKVTVKHTRINFIISILLKAQ